MAKTARKPMTFDVPADPPPAAAPRADRVERQQVGARVTTSTYRALKAHAALAGLSVQSLVEKAIEDFLAKRKS